MLSPAQFGQALALPLFFSRVLGEHAYFEGASLPFPYWLAAQEGAPALFEPAGLVLFFLGLTLSGHVVLAVRACFAEGLLCAAEGGRQES